MALTPNQQAALLACAATAIEDPAAAILCLAAVGIAYVGPIVGSAIQNFVNNLISGGTSTVACTTFHTTTSKTQGPGVCCAALTASGQTPVAGLRIAATNSKGNCIVCQVKVSTSKKNAGKLVFVRGKSVVAGSTVVCPTASEGCCALSGQ